MFEVYNPKIFYKSSEFMDEVEDQSVQLIVTSPPYAKIKDYGSEDQIGFYDSFDEFFSRLRQVWKECYRVLESQGRMIINIGDQYLRKTEYGRYRILSIVSKIINDCLEIGFDFLGDIVWQKISTTNTTGGCSLMGSIYYPRNGLVTYDYEHILIFKKYKGKSKIVPLKKKELSKISLNEWKKWYGGHWKFPGVIQKEHIAMFPEELPYRLIRMFSFIGDTILDPFLDSGTTLKVAKILFRKGIGYEINYNYKKTIEKKINNGFIGYFRDFQFLIYIIFKYCNQNAFNIQFEKQKRKGFLLLKKSNGNEIIIDYFFFDNNVFDKNQFKKEFTSKLKENSIKNYLKNKYSCTKYIIIINSKILDTTNLLFLGNEMIYELKFSKDIILIPFNQFIKNLKNLQEIL